MNFRTIINAEVFPFQIDYQSQLLFLGSCFSNHISEKIKDGGFSVTSNPFGVLYNPISIKNTFDILLEKRLFTKQDLILHKGLYHSFSHHGSFSNISEDALLSTINTGVKDYFKALKSTNIIFITFGTAWVYRYKENQQIVSNCHKIPPKAFSHFALEVEDIVSEYSELLNRLKASQPRIKIVFTVSPVRHWKDGAHENQISKATLHIAIRKLQNQFDFVYYYPSYELVMDDLRDYRFYEKDMIHINTQAIDYIYQHFRTSFYSAETRQIEQQVLKLKQALNHRPFNPDTKEHLAFVESTKKRIEQLKTKYPEINI